jgi:hypothetical protein
MDFDSWIALLVSAFMLSNAMRSHATGRFEIGWVFERVLADKTNQPFLYWFMFIGHVIAAVVCVVVVICLNAIRTA